MDLNLYGDQKILTKGLFGVDIAIQRADDLDSLAIEQIKTAKEQGQYAITALDIGCGQGGQLIRMAQAGATMAIGVDAQNYYDHTRARASENGVASRVHFIQEDMRSLRNTTLDLLTWDVIVCQRAIHYMSYTDALRSVATMHSLLSRNGRLYLSASGMSSELSNGYAEGQKSVRKRFGPLADEMRNKHGIHGNVCLYSSDDMRSLMGEAGVHIEKIWVSDFGNIKVVATKHE
jgi:cyclopropane fatty-acyl-phospholipid synthase-like methyltransferase